VGKEARKMFRWEDKRPEETFIPPRLMLRLILAIAIITNILMLVIILD